MISIGICLLTYNCVDELKDCLESVGKFYPVIVIDGKWKDFEGDHPTSTDGTLDLVESYSNVVTILSPNGSEADNRNLSLEYATNYNCDAVIILDSDERLVLPNGIWAFYRSLDRKIRENPQDLGFKITFESKKRGGTSFKRRIYLNPKELNYRGSRDIIYSKDSELRHHCPEICPNIMIVEDQSYRTEGRLKKMVERYVKCPD